jgi:DNA polymerase III delta' subunit
VRLSEIRGQDRAIARLRAAIAADRVHHAYLFTGPANSGKRTTALALASALNCVNAPGEGCDECDPCAKIAAGIHPDVVVLEREGAAQIVPIESIRANIIARVGLPPHEARVRVFVLEEASVIALQPAAANALLKTLEEPPARTMFVLGTVAPDQLLPTIRSRCQRITFAPRVGPVDDDAAMAKLSELAAAVAAFDGGLEQLLEVAARVGRGEGRGRGGAGSRRAADPRRGPRGGRRRRSRRGARARRARAARPRRAHGGDDPQRAPAAGAGGTAGEAREPVTEGEHKRRRGAARRRRRRRGSRPQASARQVREPETRNRSRKQPQAARPSARYL